MASNALSAIDEQIALLEEIYAQIDATISALKALKEKGEGLIPLSPDCFVPVKLAEDVAVVAVGSNVLLEKSIDEAVEILQKRKAQVKESIEKYRQLRRKLAERSR